MTRRLAGLARLYPRAWRRRYGAGLEALLDERPATPAVALDVVRGAASAHLAQRTTAAIWLVAALATVVADVASLRAGVTANVLWAPTDPVRALYLALTLAPVAMAMRLTVSRSRTTEAAL